MMPANPCPVRGASCWAVAGGAWSPAAGLGLVVEAIFGGHGRCSHFVRRRERATPVDPLILGGGWVFGPFPRGGVHRKSRERKWSKRPG